MQGQDEAAAHQEQAAVPPANIEPAPAPPSSHDEVMTALKGAGCFAGLEVEATDANLLGRGNFGAVRYLISCAPCHCTPARHRFLARNFGQLLQHLVSTSAGPTATGGNTWCPFVVVASDAFVGLLTI